MKKSLLVSLLVGSFCTAVAQVGETPKLDSRVNSSLKMTKLDPTAISSFSVKAPLLVKAPSTRPNLVARYARPAGTLHYGYDSEGATYQAANIIGGGFIDWTFRNFSTEDATYEWYMGEDKLDAQYIDEAGNLVLPVDLGIYSDTPKLVVSAEDSKTATFQYGTEETASGQFLEDRMLVCGGSREFFPLAMVDLQYGGLGVGYDGEVFPYIFGTGTPAPDDIEVTGATASAVVQLYEKPITPLYVRNISALVVSESENPIPTGGSLKMEIRKVDENGELTSEVIASSVMAAADMQYVSDLSKYTLFYAPFYFTKEEGGLTLQYNIVIDEACAIVISGFDQPGYDVGFLCGSQVNPVDGRGYYIVDNELYKWTYVNTDINRFDMYIQMEAIFNTLHIPNFSSTVTVPDEGGEAYFTYTNKDGETSQFNFIQVYSVFPTVRDDEECVWLDEVPDWLTIEPVEDEYEEMGVIKFVVTGEPLPADVKGRRAELVFRSFGVEARANVLQGPEAIEEATMSTVKAVQNGESFDLTYPENINSVNVLNAAGQTVATYELPANGAFTMPAANLSKGLYILKFNGERNASVKIMK